jgi:hypothetical protein
LISCYICCEHGRKAALSGGFLVSGAYRDRISLSTAWDIMSLSNRVEAMPQEAFGRGLDSLAFKDLDGEAREKRIRDAGPNDLRAALGIERAEIEEELNALGPHARQETTGSAGRLNARAQDLTDIGHAIGWWENLSATGIAPNRFDQFLETAEHNLTMIPGVKLPQFPNAALPGNVELVQGILAQAKGWGQSGRQRKYTIAAFESRDQAATDSKKQLQADLAEIHQARFSRGLVAAEAVPAPMPAPELATEPAEAPEPAASAPEPEAAQPRRVEEARDNLERLTGEQLVEALLAYSEGRTFINANVERGADMRLGDGPGQLVRGHLGYNGALSEAQRSVEWSAPGWQYRPSETVAFTPVMTAEYEDVRGLYQRVRAGTERAVKVHNPRTGEDEEAVLFQYIFASGNFDKVQADKMKPGDKGFAYQEYRGGRAGNSLAVAITIPRSMADHLRDSIRDNPQVARDLVQKLVLERSDQITDDMWTTGEHGHPIRPPYEALPPEWRMLLLSVDTPDPAHPKFGMDLEHADTIGKDRSPYTVERRQFSDAA